MEFKYKNKATFKTPKCFLFFWEDFAGRSALSCKRRCAIGAVKLGKRHLSAAISLAPDAEALSHRACAFENP